MKHGREVQGEAKEERSVDDWMIMIAREEAGGDAAAEAELLAEFRDWEARSKCAPNGKWRGANSRKWGKVGIEMRLTGNVPCTEGPETQLGRIICKFVDIVDERPAACSDEAPLPLAATVRPPLLAPDQQLAVLWPERSDGRSSCAGEYAE